MDARAPGAVFFDFGGVYYTDGFRDGLYAMARKTGLAPRVFFEAAVRAVFDSGYVTGEAPERAFWKALAEAVGTGEDLHSNRGLILGAFRPRKGMADLVREIRGSAHVALITDQTNWLYELDSRDHFFGEFDSVTTSYEEGFSKREPEIFRVACQRANVFPEEALFFDDNMDNVLAAEDFGLSAHLFTDVPSARRTLRASGLLSALEGDDPDDC